MTDALQAAPPDTTTTAKKPTKTAKKPTKPVGTNVVTLRQLCTELKIDSTLARIKLRSAMGDAKNFPALAKHKKGASWEWKKGDAAIKEVRAVLKD